MIGIDFDKWTPVPNLEIETLYRNKHVPVKVRVRWTIIRMILGFEKNRANMAADISYTTLAKKTDANVRSVKRAVEELDGKDGISISRGCGRGHRNVYCLDLDGHEGNKR